MDKKINRCIECYSINERITPLNNSLECLKNHLQYICGTCGRSICINQKNGLHRCDFPFKSLCDAILYLRTMDYLTKSSSAIYPVQNDKGRSFYKIFTSGKKEDYQKKNPTFVIGEKEFSVEPFTLFPKTRTKQLSTDEVNQYLYEKGLKEKKISFLPISKAKIGTIKQILKDAYQMDKRFETDFKDNWQETDDFFYSNLNIADKYAFFIVLDQEIIGFISYDLRNLPNVVEIGYNGIIQKEKGKGYGKIQLLEAIRRIKKLNPKRIQVTSNEALKSAIANYKSVGFVQVMERKNEVTYQGNFVDFVLEIGNREDEENA